MTRKVKKGLLWQAYGLVAKASLEQLDVKERVELVKMLRTVKPQVEEIDGFLNDLREKNADINSEDKIRELNKITDEEMKQNVELTVGISAGMKDKLLESNPGWTGGQIILLEDVFEAKTEKNAI